MCVSGPERERERERQAASERQAVWCFFVLLHRAGLRSASVVRHPQLPEQGAGGPGWPVLPPSPSEDILGEAQRGWGLGEHGEGLWAAEDEQAMMAISL